MTDDFGKNFLVLYTNDVADELIEGLKKAHPDIYELQRRAYLVRHDGISSEVATNAGLKSYGDPETQVDGVVFRLSKWYSSYTDPRVGA